MLPLLWPTTLICGATGSDHVTEPETAPRMTTRSIPDGMADAGRLPFDGVTTMVSALEAQRPSWWDMQTPGPMLEHSASALQARHALVAALQIGVEPEQVELSVHCTQAPVLAHVGWATSTAAHCAEAVQPAQVWESVLQTGVDPEQLVLVRHCTHLFVLVSHTGVGAEQLELSVHSTHAPLARQAGWAGDVCLHWAEDVQPVHVRLAVLQMGVAPEQLALVRHCTHLFAPVSQMGVPAEQVELSVHCTQAPAGEQTGVVGSATLHWAAVVHATQVFVVLSQMGALAGQPADVRHCTHLFVPVSHTGVAPAQSASPAHCTQAPVVEQIGCAASIPRHCVDAVHGPQVPSAHSGDVAGQVALVRQPTQVPLAEHSVREGSFRAMH